MSECVRYAACPAAVRRAELEGLCLLFHAASGMTHVLAPPAPQILDVLAAGPASLAELRDGLAERFDVEGDAAELAARVAELEAAGLVLRVA